MFDKIKFAAIIKNIKGYYSSQEEFSKKSEIGRTYLSQYMNAKLDDPPSPKILEKLANSSKGITTYNELMFICGYTDQYQNKDDYLESEDLFNSMMYKLNDAKLSTHELSQLKNICLHNTRNDEANISINEFINKFPEKLQTRILNFYNEFLDKKFTHIRNKLAHSEYYRVPVYGQISAGQPNWAEECLEGYLPIDPELMNIINPEECFFLRVNGESMNKVIKNGAYALIRKQDIVENGEIAAVLVNGNDATIKKFTRQKDLVVLEPMSDDISFQTQIYDKSTSIKILGKYIGKFEINN